MKRLASLFTLAAVALGACQDAAPTEARPAAGPLAARGGSDKITICHAAGRAGTTHYVEITVSANAANGHFYENGTPMAGHEQDYLAAEGSGCMDVRKEFVAAYVAGPNGTMVKLAPMSHELNGQMLDMYMFPANSASSPSTIWIEYKITYANASTAGTLTDDIAGPCGNLRNAFGYLDPQFTCTSAGFVGHVGGDQTGSAGTAWSIPVSGSGSVSILVDVTNAGGCGDRPYENEARLTTSGRSTSVVADKVWLWSDHC